MGAIGTWLITALAGFLISGNNVLGAILGLALGVMYTTAFSQKPIVVSQNQQNQSNDFTHVLLILTAHIMKADGKLMRSELDFIRSFFERRLGYEKTQELMVRLRDLLNNDFEINQVCRKIRMGMIYPMRLELLHFLFGIASADGDVNPNELIELERVSAYIGIGMPDYEAIKAMFYKRNEPGSAYTILEINQNASDEEVKKAYRKMAVKFHPDKVSHLGDEYQSAAKEKFQKVQQAYEYIKKIRGMQ
jgi:DnaJ like chaperone protein